MENDDDRKELAKHGDDNDEFTYYFPVEVHIQIKSHLIPQDWDNYDVAFEGMLSIPNPPVIIPSQGPMKNSPWLMYRRDYSDLSSFFIHPLYRGDKSVVQVPVELSVSIIRAAKFGWLLISEGHSLFFFNPFTKSMIRLPPVANVYFTHGVTFSSPPTSLDCVVVCFHRTGESTTLIRAIRRGQRTWSWSEFDNGIPFYPSSDCNPVFYNGVFYCLGIHGNLGVFDPLRSSWRVLDDPRQPTRSESLYHGFLLESDGKLFSVFMSDMGTNLSVFSLDDSSAPKLVWKEVASLDDQMLFLSRTACTAAKSQIKGMGNKIYLAKLHEAGTSDSRDGKIKREEVIFYSLDSRRYETFGSSYSRWSSKNLYDSKEYFICTWIEPEPVTKKHWAEELDWLSTPIITALDIDLS